MKRICSSVEYFADTDTFSIALQKIVPNLISISDEVTPGLLVDYASDSRIIQLDICDARLRVKETSLCVATKIKKDHEQIAIDLGKFEQDDHALSKKLSTDDHRIEIVMDDDGWWSKICINNILIDSDCWNLAESI